MNDKDISLNSATAYVLWVVGAGLILWRMFTGDPTAELGLLAAGIGGVLTIRTFFCSQSRRELTAFNLGRESVRNLH